MIDFVVRDESTSGTTLYFPTEASYTIGRYAYPTLTRSGDDLTLTNPNENGTNSKLMYYINDNSPQDYTGPITVTTTNTTYHFYVTGTAYNTGSDKMKSYELVTTASPLSTLDNLTASDITEDRLAETITNSTSAAVHYRVGTSGNWSTLAAGASLDVSDAPANTLYQFAHVTMRTEAIMLGSTEISSTEVADAVSPNIYSVTISRYPAPTVIPNFRQLSPLVFSVTAPDGTPDVVVRYTESALSNLHVNASSSTVPAGGTVHVRAPLTYRFRTFGSTAAPDLYPSVETRPYPVLRYDPPSILNFDPGDATNLINPTGTLESATNVIYINYSHTDANGLLDPDPSDANTYDVVYEINNTNHGYLPAGITNPNFKMVVSTKPGNDPTKFPSTVVTVSSSYTGYYVIAHYDATAGKHFYLALDSTATGTATHPFMYTTDTFDHSCLWFYNGNNALVQRLFGHRYFLMRDGNGKLCVQKDVADNAATDWDIYGNYNALVIESMTVFDEQEHLTAPMVRFNTTTHQWELFTYVQGESGYPQQVVFPAYQRIAAAAEFNELEDVRLSNITCNGDQPNWITIDQADVTLDLSATLSGKIVPYVLPAHLHYTFTDAGDRTEDFTFYVGPDPDNPVNLSYSDHRELPSRVRTTSDRHINFGSVNAHNVAIRYEWRRLDGLAAYQTVYPNQKASFRWPSSLEATDTVVIPNPTGGLALGSYRLFDGLNAQDNLSTTASLVSLANGSSRTDTVVLVAICTLAHSVNDADPTVLEVYSRPLEINFGRPANSLTARDPNNNPVTFQNGGTYLLANCGDRATATYSNRHYLTTNNSDPATAQPVLSKQAENMYRAFKVTQVGNYYTFENVGLSHQAGDGNHVYLTYNSNTHDPEACFDEGTPAAQYATTATVGDNQKFKLVPYAEESGNIFFLLRPKALEGTQGTLCPLTGSDQMTNATHEGSDAEDFMEGTTLRIGPGEISLMDSHSVSNPTPTTGNFSNAYFYGGFWQLVVPTLLPPQLTMDRHGNVSLTDEEATIRSITGQIKYQISPTPSGDTWSDEAVYTPGSTTITLAENYRIRYWKEPATEGAAIPSPQKVFKAIKMAVPEVTEVRNYLIFSDPEPTQLGGPQLANAVIRYTTDGSDPDDYDAAENPSVPETYNAANGITLVYACNVGFRAYADNYLCSDLVPFPHTAYLQLSIDNSGVPQVATVNGHPAVEDYVIVFTTDGRKPEYHWDDPTGRVGDVWNSSTNPLPTTDADILRIMAFPASESAYRSYYNSNEERIYSGGHYIVFSHVDNPEYTLAQHQQRDTLLSTEHDPVGNIIYKKDVDFHMMLLHYNDPSAANYHYAYTADGNHGIDSTLVFRHVVDRNGTTYIYNGSTGTFLGFDENKYISVEPYTELTMPISWTWGGAPTYTYSNNTATRDPELPSHYTLQTTNDEDDDPSTPDVTRYLVYVDNDAAHPWQARTADEIAANNGHMHKKVAYKADLKPYIVDPENADPALRGQDFSPKGVNLFVEDGTDNWVPLATDNNAWIANVENETVRLRASLQGLRIQYASNIDINIYNTAYDRGNPADPNTFVPWQQWHQFYTPATNRENQWYSHSYKDVPGYTETYVDDEQTEGTITWSDLQGTNCSTYYQNRTVSSDDDRILSFERTGITATTPARTDFTPCSTDFTTFLTVRYEHGSSYDNSGTPLDRTVTLRLFADKADATTAPALPAVLTNHDGTRLKLGDGSDRYLAVLPDKLATADEVIGAPFLLGQASLGIAPYSSAAFWTIEQRTENTSLYTLHNQAFRHYSDNGHESGYSTYHRASDRKGGIYIVDMDENTNEALFNYLHPVEGNAPRSPFDLAVYNANMRYAFRVNSDGTVSILSDLAHPDIVYSASDNTWQHRRRGAVQLAENETEATPEACTTDFWGRRWIPQEAPQTPPTITLYPDGKVKLTHPDQDEQNLTFKYQIVDGENAELPTDWPADAITYDDANRPTLTDNQKIFTASVKHQDEANEEISQGVTSYVAYRTPTPTLQIDAITGDTNYILGEGTNMVVGYNQRKGNLHYNTIASAVVSHTEGQRVRYSATMSEAIDNGSIISILSWEMGKLESVPLRLGKQQDITLAITAIDLSTTGEALVTARLTSATQMQPILDYIAVRYKMDGNVTTSSTRLTPVAGNTLSDVGTYITIPEVTGVPNAISIQFKVDLRDYEANAAPVLYLKAYPDLYAFYNESNEARQTLIGSDYTGSMPTADDGVVYPINSAAEYVSVVNAINAPATHDTYKACSFKVTADSLELGNIAVASIADFQGYWNGNYCKVKGLKNPMFTSCTDAHVYNVVLDYVAIDNSGVTGAICCTANGDTRIYNSGVRATTTSTVQGSGVTGGLVGQLNGNSRVINCYNFANVISTGANAGGIVGGQQTASTTETQAGIVFNCMNYGDVTASSGSAGPVLAGTVFTNNHKDNKGINTYNYYRYELEKTGASIAYNCARAAEERYLTRFEFYRGILNSNLKKCGWWTYATSNNYSETTEDGETIGKWVLDKSIAPYPVVQPKYDASGNAIQYASVINPDYEASWRDTETRDYHGKKLGTLSVTVKSGDKYKHVVDEQTVEYSETITLNITDMDTTRFDFSYGKIQLPYFQKVFGKGSYIQEVTESSKKVDYIVTGWDITAETTDGTVTYNNWTSTGTDNPYNFADRKCTDKDEHRTFAQGGYYNVPEGVTAITITAHWGKVVYLGATGHDYTYNDAFDATSRTDLYGTKNNNYTYASPNATVGKTVYNTLEDAYKELGSLTSVYDQAIVAVSNCNLYWKGGNTPCKGNNAFTLMSLDEDNDCEPDYCCFTHFNTRNDVAPIRFDFIWMPGSGITYKITKSDGTGVSKYCPDMGIWKPKGWFEITETALQHYGQFEYYSTSGSAVPLILNNGVIDQFCSTNQDKVSNNSYMILGGHVWFKVFAPGTHGDKNTKTKHCPVNVLGGDYEKFYLSGYFSPDASTEAGDNVYFYANGGKFGEFASGGQERITGNVTIKADHIIADEFYGGGVNPKNWGSTNAPKYQVQGNITVSLRNSKIGTYAGTKFSSLMSGKTITTVAENTEFGTYYGAGIGGSGLNRDRTGQSETSHRSLWSSNTSSGGAPNGLSGALSDYRFGQMILSSSVKQGVVVDYEMEMIPYSGFIDDRAVGRFYRYEASLSKANANNVFSTLTNCTVNNDFYGGGFVGTVSGTANSTLTDCTIYGSVYAGGNNSDIPYIDAYDLPRKADNTFDVPWYDETEAVIHPAPRSQRVGRYYWKYDATRAYNHGSPELGTELIDGETKYYIYTNESFDNIGVVNQTNLTLNGNTIVYGKAFGGGDEAPVKGDAMVTVEGNAYIESDVFGGGNVAPVDGTCTVKIGKPKTDFPEAEQDDYKVIDHRPWIKGDIYGGGNEADVKGNTSVTIYAGIVGPVYGGGCEGSVLPSSTDNTILGNTEVNMLGGWVGYRPTPVKSSEVASLEAAGNRIVKIGDDYWNYSIPAAEVIDVEGKLMGRDKSYYGIFGGGFGLGTVVAGTATVHVGDGAQPMNTGVHIYGSVYGGGEAGQVNGGYKAFDTEGLTSIPNDATYYKFTEPVGNVLYPVVVSASTAIDPNESYYTFIEPSFTVGPATKVVVSTSPDADSSVYVEGAVFGGGRGYMVNMLDNEEANFVGNEVEVRTAMAGAVYGNAEVTVGKPLTDRNKVQIKSIEYFTPKEKGEEYRLVGANDLTSGAVYWKENLYVFDVTTQRYEPVTPGEPFEEITVRTKEGGKMKMNRSANKVIDGVQYYLQSGRVSVAGGGELGAVYSSTALDADRCIQKPSTRSPGTMTGGNTTVTLKSGLLGDVHSGEVDGCVYGGGLQATVDGVAQVNVASGEGAQPASHYLWVRGDIYAGGCMGEVLNFQDQPYATEQVITGGWLRNAHGGSNLVEHNSRGNSHLQIGVTNANNDNILISESAYGGNGFSPSDGETKVEVHSGKIGFAYTNVAINTESDDETDKLPDPSGENAHTIVPNDANSLLAYEGNVYGGGFGAMARVNKTTVTVDGGIIRDGVFGGGEVAPVYVPWKSGGNKGTYTHKFYNSSNAQDDSVAAYYVIESDPLTTVNVSGGEMAMVCGGGRGYTSFITTTTGTPGAIMGNTSVTISGGTVRSFSVSGNDTTLYYSSALGGGNVYGGGLEGIVTGNTEVHITDGEIKGNAFAGGRGYSKAMFVRQTETIKDRSSREAGWVLGNTLMDVTGGKVRQGVYGGGEGLIYKDGSNVDIVACVQGNATVKIHGGYVGTITDNTSEQFNYAYGSYAGGRVANVLGYANMLVYGDATVSAVYGGNDITGKVIGAGRPTTGTDTTKDSYNKLVISERTNTSDEASVVTSTYVRINSIDSKSGFPKVGRVFGGGNGDYDYYNATEYTHLNLTYPNQPSTYVDLSTTSGNIGMACGGGNKAPVVDALVKYHGSGHVDTIFAGGNSATVTNSATVLFDATTTTPPNDNQVDYLFGGNNRATMDILPDILLTKGTVGKVYGGGNRGAMVGYGTKPDVFGRDVTPISTYVLINSEGVKVTDAVFGGCNNAPVRNLAYVDMRNGSIEKLFGGNDVSETAYGARVDMVGGTVQKLFGGGNGYYNYTRVGYRWNVTTKEDTPQKVVDNSKGYPYVDTTNVNIWGGTVNNSIYGGGYAGDCRITHVVINDAATFNGKTLGEGDLAGIGGNAHIEGTVFGGGYGDQALLGTVWDGQHLVKHDHVGNVKGQIDNSRTLARTDLYHVSYLKNAFAYGGGEAGDVENAVINVYPSWNKRFDAIYGGCWGSDVRGTATVNLYCEAPDPTTLGPGESPYNITYVYGGNDFTGTVNRSVLNIYSGRYDKVFGGGNGLYDQITLNGTPYALDITADGSYTEHTENPASPAEGRPSNTDPVAPEGAHIGNNYGLTVPNSIFPVTNIYDKKAVDDPDNTPGTIIDGNVYGGGNLGISRVVKDGTPSSLSDYAFVQVNVHGGQFGNDIFAGAAGKADMEALIQGLKVLNMDGGTVTNSVYGGSKSVNDGYPVECQSVDWTDATDVAHTYDTTRTTMRPTSILNLVGGYIGNNVYGAGYLGLVDGSVYVNVGKEAVEQSVAYNRGYRYPNTTTYARYNGQNDPYMPHFVTEADESTGSALGSNLIPADLTLNASIYNGANWGNTAGSDDGTPSYMFTTAGFHGGESRIRIDGEGYKTSDVTGLPLMDIKYSLIGAGTSCEGGDVVRDIRVLNYGKWENCSTTKELFSIQRADSVVFKNVGLTLTGDQDAFSAYPSSKIAMTRCDTVVFIEHNTLQLEKPAIKLHHLAFVDADPTKPEGKGNVIEGQTQLEAMYNSIDATTCNSNTSDHVAECLVVSPVAGSTTLPYATILVNNGAYIDIFDENESSGVTYYDVKGYGFLRAEDNTQAVVTARCKRAEAETVDETTYNAINTTDGGFLGLCPADNTKEQFTVGTTTMGQFNYDNYGYANNTYRAWKFGTGIRMRQVTLIAHTNPSELPDINKNLPVDTIDRYGVSHSVSNIAVAMATLELPPTTPGSHYELVGGITVDQENREMVLVDAAFIPDDFTASTLSGSWMAAATATALNPVAPENATPEQIAAAESARQTINAVVNQITQHPSNTFGLALARGESFDATCASGTGSGRPIRCNPNCQTAINGNAYFDGSNGYATTLVDPTGATNVKPSLNLYLTYAKDFTTTLMGDVKFTLTEKDASNNVVGYVEVTISLSTILQEFKDQKYDLVAMKNKFDRHTYSRKLILPASMQKRSLYLTGIEWEPVFEHSTDSIGTPANFALTDTATAAASATRATLGDNTFGLRIMPTEDLSASLTTTLGWYSMAQDYASGLDVSSKSTYVHTIATDNAGSTATRRVYSSNPAAEVINGAETTYHRIIDLKNSGNSDKGEMVGVLDGRSSAAVDFTLYYNDLGETPYVAGVRGKVKLYFDYYQRSSAGSEEKDLGDAKHFTVTLNIKTRDKGDTIYVASAPYIERDGIRLYPYGKVQGGLNGSHYAYNSGNGSNGTYSQEPVEDSPTYLKKGKEPMAYVQSFEEALKYPVYEEGNVICVLDEVRIDNKTTFSMHGSSGNPIPIVRYTGSHYQFPGEECAYRGPMVSIREEGQFACHDVIIDGRMVGSRFKLTQGTYTPSSSEHYVTVNHGGVDYYATEIAALKAWDGDTLRAFAPVFEIRDGGILSLGNNVQIRNCWNAETTAVSYTQTLDNSDPGHPVTVSRLSKAPGSVVYIHKPTATYSLPTDLAGSLAHIANPTLIVSDNLTIEHNVVGGVTGPDVNSLHSGAIYLEDGVVEIGTTNSKKAIKIQDNYALPAACAPVNDPATAGLWATDGNTWSLNTTYLEDQKKANVYLHWVPKTLGTGGAKTDPATSEILDEKSAYVSVNNEPSKNTRIGISKEFPGGNPAVRDTMVVARVTNGRDQYATRAYDRNIFTNDNRITSSDGAPILFRAPISPSNLYFQRCATFKKQLFDEDLTYNTNILPDATHDPIQLTNGRQLSVLTYEPNNNASCPDESDMVTYSVHGGFYPYTYSWSWGTDANNLVEYSKFTTPYTNEEVNADLYASTPDYTKATESNSNTAPVKGKPRANSTIYYYSVTATDLAGCELTKKFNVNITYGTPASGFPTNFNRGSRLALGTDDAAWNDTLKTHVALATRQYTGLHLEKQVVPAKNPAWGDFTATYDYGGTGAVHFVGETDGDGNDIATRLCPGDVINLSATGQNGHKFLQWDFDPYDEPVTSLVMPNINVNKTITAYFSPGDYWKNVVDGSTTAVTNSDYVVEYDGDVHIYTENGLAWLISQCNGLNGQQVHTFFYDTVFIHPKSDGTDYDMSDHLWTPLGIAQNPFGGVLTTPAVASSGSSAKDGEGEGEGEGEGGETPVVRETVTIKGIIVNEPMMDNVGFFGNIQDATIDGLNISYSVFRGQQYVGGIAAQAKNSTITNSSVNDRDGANVTIITGNHTTGGIVADAENTNIDVNSSGVKFMGATVYSGGIAGHTKNGKITNNNVSYEPKSSTLYSAGIVGYYEGTTLPSSSKSSNNQSIVNNYVRFAPDIKAGTRVGGLVGTATNALLANNYVYGHNDGARVSGGLAAVLGNGVHVENCFYEQGFDRQAFGFHSTLDTSAVSTFSGSGNNVILTDTLGRNVNLTRQLNRWVRAHGDASLSYWRSDTSDINNGYPLFGEAEYQEIVDTFDIASCDSFRVDGTLVNQSGLYFYRVVDSTEFTDSLITVNLTINYGVLTELSDTILQGDGYDGYGFHLTATEIDLMRQALQQEGTVTVVVTDTLQTLAGCDSIVTLYLTLSNTGNPVPVAAIDLKVYPNPTTKNVNVEGSGIYEVELYDAVSRRLSQFTILNSQLSIDLEGYPAGAYYLRIRTDHGTVIKKVIKR